MIFIFNLYIDYKFEIAFAQSFDLITAFCYGGLIKLFALKD